MEQIQSDDRQAIQDEIDQLTTEIDRVAETTKFNEIYLLKGDSVTNGDGTGLAFNAGNEGPLRLMLVRQKLPTH